VVPLDRVSDLLRFPWVSYGFQAFSIATEDVVILGHVVPKGTNIIVLTSFPGMYTDKSSASQLALLDAVRSKTSREHGLSNGLWDNDGQEFKPERWLVEYTAPDGSLVVKYSPKQGTSAPFGFGVRACFGMRLAVSYPLNFLVP